MPFYTEHYLQQVARFTMEKGDPQRREDRAISLKPQKCCVGAWTLGD